MKPSDRKICQCGVKALTLEEILVKVYCHDWGTIEALIAIKAHYLKMVPEDIDEAKYIYKDYCRGAEYHNAACKTMRERIRREK